jgi:hypothetical protein
MPAPDEGAHVGARLWDRASRDRIAVAGPASGFTDMRSAPQMQEAVER